MVIGIVEEMFARVRELPNTDMYKYNILYYIYLCCKMIGKTYTRVSCTNDYLFYSHFNSLNAYDVGNIIVYYKLCKNDPLNNCPLRAMVLKK